MAKEDFCFTYYDGDAARDKAHLDRLSRGAYDDIISAQRKFGHLTLDAIKRVLGSDFEKCWPPIEWIMKVDEEGKYYIEWLNNSVEKMRAAAKKQKEKVDEYWAKKKGEKYHGNTTEIPRYKKNDTVDIPLEDGNGYGNIKDKEEENKGGMGEEGEEEKGTTKLNDTLLVPRMMTTWKAAAKTYPIDIDKDYPALQSLARFLFAQENINYDVSNSDSIGQILTIWQGLASYIASHDFFRKYSLKQVDSHIQSIIQDYHNGKQNTGKQPTGSQVSTSSAFAAIDLMFAKTGNSGAKTGS